MAFNKMDTDLFKTDGTEESTLIECVINISEGRDRSLIYILEDTFRRFPNVMHMHTDISEDANRSVITFGGPPQAVFDAAFELTERATFLIDMNLQTGCHPRIGAVDVIPFIPLRGISLQETSLWAIELGKKLGKELELPIYLYGESAQSSDRKLLPAIRKGNYEKLEERINNGFTPDFGPNQFNPQTGATVLGARNLMAAYNINLNTEDVQVAQEIAREIRGSGKNVNGKQLPGRFESVQAKGWLMKEYKCAQVTTNIHNLTKTSLHEVYEAVDQAAKKAGYRANGSELIGLIPLSAMIDSGAHYQKKDNQEYEESEEILIQTAIEKLGLNSIAPFNPELRIIERLLKDY